MFGVSEKNSHITSEFCLKNISSINSQEKEDHKQMVR